MNGDRPRQPPPPWERDSAYPMHPNGRARRRWPRMYDGGADPPEELIDRRYRRAFQADQMARQRRTPRRAALETLRRSPVRNGLVGLAVAGTAAPIAVNRYQTSLRTDPANERIVTHSAASGDTTDASLTDRWQALEAERTLTQQERDSAIDQYLVQYAEYDLTRELAEEIYDSATENEIDPEVAYGLVRAESSFRNSSTSPVGAVGLTQLMPRTAEWLQPGVTRTELRQPSTNLRIGFRYLRSLIEKYDGNTNLALTAYNRGPGTVDKELRRGRNPDNGYADFVYGKEGHGHRLYTHR